jgi:DNA-binding XRE family transcriptional regulator
MNATTLSTAPSRLSWGPFSVGLLVPVTVFGLGIGTGGAATLNYVKERGTRGYPYVICDSAKRSPKAVAAYTPAENLEHVRAVLKLTVTDLASMLGVSRQAIYDWQAGKSIAPENALRLAGIARAADILAAEGLKGVSHLLRRPIRNGKSFVDVVREGDSASTAASAVLELVRRESHQQEALRSRLAGRARPSRDAFEDIGAPMLDEEG